VTARPPLLGFSAGSGDVVAALDDLLESGLFVQGVTRSGKSNFVRVVLEQTYGHVLQLVLDPEGEYHTIRTPDRPYLIAGRGRDVELSPDADVVRRFVDAIVERGVSTVVDLFNYEADEQQLIVAAVCDALVQLPESHPGNTLVVIEELQEFAPEGGGKGSALRSVTRLSKRGLKRGVAIAGASQRVADVANAVITQLKSKAIGGTDAADIPRALDVLGLPRSQREAVLELKRGEFWVKGPAFTQRATLVRLPKAETAPAKRRRGQPPAPSADAPAEIASLAAALAAALQQPTAEETSRRVERGGSHLPVTESPTMHTPAELQEARERGYARGRCDGITAVRGHLETVIEELEILTARARTCVAICDDQSKAGDAGDGYREGAHDTATARGKARPPVSASPPAPRPAPAASAAGSRAMKKGEQRILDAIAWYVGMGIPRPTRAQIAAAVEIAPSNPIFRTRFGSLRNAGMIEGDDEGWTLTDAGVALADASSAPTTRAELHARWREKLPRRLQVLFDALVTTYPRALTKSDLAAAANVEPTNPIFRTWYGQLRNLGMFDEQGDQVAASALLFPRGLR